VKLHQQRRALNSKVVIAEDEPAIAEVPKTALENYGFAVTTFDGDSFEAFGLTLAQELHVFVCDMKLPGVSGTALCKAVLEKYPKCEVILMTGLSMFQMLWSLATASSFQFCCASLSP
jgi:DNA-binding NtrC family response regulator